MKVAVIPARGQSKRIPRKNVKDFCGKPIIGWSIEAAINTGLFDKIMVSTDDQEIAEVARSFGAETPFIRPAELSDDFTGIIPVVAHAIEWLAANDERPATEICCILATAPFVLPADLAAGAEQLQQQRCDYAFSVTDFAFPIQRAIRILHENRVEMFWPENFDIRSQDLKQAYHDAGQFYWGHADAWLAGRSIFSDKAVPIILPHYRVQDIDTPEDWIRAEHMFLSIQKEQLNE